MGGVFFFCMDPAFRTPYNRLGTTSTFVSARRQRMGTWTAECFIASYSNSSFGSRTLERQGSVRFTPALCYLVMVRYGWAMIDLILDTIVCFFSTCWRARHAFSRWF